MVALLIPGLIWWIASSFAVAKAAGARGRSFDAWLGMALALGPIVAPLVLLCYPPQPQEETMHSAAPTLAE